MNPREPHLSLWIYGQLVIRGYCAVISYSISSAGAVKKPTILAFLCIGAEFLEPNGVARSITLKRSQQWDYFFYLAYFADVWCYFSRLGRHDRRGSRLRKFQPRYVPLEQNLDVLWVTGAGNLTDF